MIKASELRIGNWIKKDNKEYQAHALTIFCCGNDHHPILLTQEWIIKFGFVNTKGAHPSWIEKQVKEGWVFSMQYLIVTSRAFYGKTEIKYVHQLQNLYYSLTGEELIIKTP